MTSSNTEKINADSKKEIVLVENASTPVDSSAEAEAEAVDEAKLLRKLDWHLIPFFSLMYLLAFLDRSAIGNARLYGLETDLKITDKQYLLALTVFFFSYSLLEPPSNLVLKFVRPSIWLSLLLLIWGFCVIMQGLVQSFGGLAALRLLLGVFESGFFPGAVFCLSCWYKRSQLGFRVAVFSSAQTFSGAFGGLLAAAISKMDGIGGKPAWAWIFIIEGLLTIAVSIISFWAIDDYPETSKFLTPKERKYLLESLQADGQVFVSQETFKFKRVWQALSDYRLYIAMLLFAGFDGSLYAFSLFTPSIINQLGFHANIANLLSVPVYALACTVTCLAGYYADRTPNVKGYVNLFFLAIGIIGYGILVASRDAGLSYFAVYLAACAIYPTIPNSIAWVSANTEGPLKRSIALAMCIGFGNLNGAVTSNVVRLAQPNRGTGAHRFDMGLNQYRSNQQPWYTLGHAIVLGYLSIGFVATLGYWVTCRQENARRDKGLKDEVIINQEGGREENGVFASVAEARLEKGDKWSGFRYVL